MSWSPSTAWYSPPEPSCRKEPDECACEACHEVHLDGDIKDIFQNSVEGLECCKDFIENECCPNFPIKHGNREMTPTNQCLLCEGE